MKSAELKKGQVVVIVRDGHDGEDLGVGEVIHVTPTQVVVSDPFHPAHKLRYKNSKWSDKMDHIDRGSVRYGISKEFYFSTLRELGKGEDVESLRNEISRKRKKKQDERKAEEKKEQDERDEKEKKYREKMEAFWAYRGKDLIENAPQVTTHLGPTSIITFDDRGGRRTTVFALIWEGPDPWMRDSENQATIVQAIICSFHGEQIGNGAGSSSSGTMRCKDMVELIYEIVH